MFLFFSIWRNLKALTSLIQYVLLLFFLDVGADLLRSRSDSAVRGEALTRKPPSETTANLLSYFSDALITNN